MKTKTQSVEWIIVHDGTRPWRKPYEMECLRCGQRVHTSLPIAVNQWLALAKEFKKRHKRFSTAEGALHSKRLTDNG